MAWSTQLVATRMLSIHWVRTMLASCSILQLPAAAAQRLLVGERVTVKVRAPKAAPDPVKQLGRQAQQGRRGR